MLFTFLNDIFGILQNGCFLQLQVLNVDINANLFGLPRHILKLRFCFSLVKEYLFSK